MFFLMLVNLAGASPFAYITNLNDGTVSVIDTFTNKVTDTINVPGPWGVAVNPDGKKVYVAGGVGVSVIETDTNTVTATVKIEGGDYGVAVNPAGTKVYVVKVGLPPEYKGTVYVIDTATNTVTATVNVGNNPYGVAVSPDGTKVYVTNSGDYINPGNTVSVIDAATNTVIATVPVGKWPMGVAVTPDGTKVYVVNRLGYTVSVIDAATNTVTATVKVGARPYGVAVNPAGTKVYVANYYSHTVSVIDATKNKVTATVKVGKYPEGVAITPDGAKVYAVNTIDNTVSVIDTTTNTVIATIEVGRLPLVFGQFIGPISLAPLTNFSAKPTEGNVPLTVTFTDESTKSPTKWMWTFGDGATSTQQNPEHKYSNIGSYTVTLTATNDNGSNTVTKTDYITVVTKPVANFTSNVTSGKVPFNVAFTDTSTGIPAGWIWNFGDGRTSTIQNPLHTYFKAGNYTVSLTVSNVVGSNTVRKTDYITVVGKPTVEFSAKPTSGKSPLTVAFNDTSTGSPIKWKWTFGDGTTSIKQNPTHKYSNVGRYTVTLIATNGNGNSKLTKTDYIKVVTKPVANFTSSVTSGKAFFTVAFTDTSTGIPTGWYWNFGDGTTSVSQNPLHTYLKAGNYTVRLKASSIAGSNMITKADYINVTK